MVVTVVIVSVFCLACLYIGFRAGYSIGKMDGECEEYGRLNNR